MTLLDTVTFPSHAAAEILEQPVERMRTGGATRHSARRILELVRAGRRTTVDEAAGSMLTHIEQTQPDIAAAFEAALNAWIDALPPPTPLSREEFLTDMSLMMSSAELAQAARIFDVASRTCPADLPD
jgi:hypothetical protein